MQDLEFRMLLSVCAVLRVPGAAQAPRVCAHLYEPEIALSPSTSRNF